MKLGVSYNLFDGEELIEASIKETRKFSDFVSIVYQSVSNYGEKLPEGVIELVHGLKEKGYIDELQHYIPDEKKQPTENELIKRNIGLELSKKNECTHHMSMDSDEFYIKDQFEYVKLCMIKGDFDSCACQMVTYYQKPYYRLEPKEQYFVSLFFKIEDQRKYELGIPFPVLVDGTRRMKTNNCKLFSREEIEMHHMSYVRRDIELKLRNSSAKRGISSNIPRFMKHYNNWKFPDKILWPNGKWYNSVRTQNLFNIEI